MANSTKQISDKLKNLIATGNLEKTVITAPMGVGKTEEVETTVVPVLFTDQQAFWDPRSLKDILPKNLSKEKTLQKIKALCNARMQLYLQIQRFSLEGPADQALELYYQMVTGNKSHIKRVRVFDEVLRKEWAHSQSYFLIRYEKVLKKMESNSVGNNVDDIFISFFQNYMAHKIQWENYSKTHMSYTYKKNFCEHEYWFSLVQMLQPYTSSSFYSELEKYSQILFLKSDEHCNETGIVINDGQFVKDRYNLIKTLLLDFLKLVNKVVNPFSEIYCDIYFKNIEEIKDQLFELIGLFNAQAALDKSKKEYDMGQSNYRKMFPKFDTMINAIKMLSKNFLETHEKMSRLKQRMDALERENIEKINTFLVGIQEKLKNIPKGSIQNNQRKLELDQEANFIYKKMMVLFKEEIPRVFKSYNGDNVSEIEYELNKVPDKLFEIHVKCKMFSDYVGEISESLKLKQESANKLLDEVSKKKAEVEAKLVLESKKSYEERKKKHDDEISLRLQAKEKLKAAEKEKLRLAEKEANREKMESLHKERESAPVSFNAKMQAEVIRTLLNSSQIQVLIQIFSTPTPHCIIPYQKVINLIKALGGEIFAPGGSHQHVKMITLNNIIGYNLIQSDEEDDDESENIINTKSLKENTGMPSIDTSTISNASSVNNGIATGTLVKPHKKGHNDCKLSGFSVELFRNILERAGYTRDLIFNNDSKNSETKKNATFKT